MQQVWACVNRPVSLYSCLKTHLFLSTPTHNDCLNQDMSYDMAWSGKVNVYKGSIQIITHCTEAEAKVAHTFLPLIGSKLGDVSMESLSVCNKKQGQCFPSHSECYSVFYLCL